MTSDIAGIIELRKERSHWVASFTAMANLCEALIRCESESEARKLASLAQLEALRIERTFSRYRDDNIIHAINHAQGEPVKLDDETLGLLKYAGECFELSDGMFDITSGVLRRAWRFDAEELEPDQKLIDSLLELVGWRKVSLSQEEIRIPAGMEIDLGGIGKEYAVDRVAQIVHDYSGVSVMVNFGGDIRAIAGTNDSEPWQVGVEDPNQRGRAVDLLDLADGAIATSGLSYRHCFVNGKKLGHILNPKTGWPVENPPQSVTVAANFCMEAGLLTTLAMMHGPEADSFLRSQQVDFYHIS